MNHIYISAAIGGGYFAAIDWEQVATVVVAGVGIVLAVLIVLIFVFSAFGSIVSKMQNLGKKKAKKEKAAASDEKIKPSPVQPAVKPVPVTTPPVVEQGISGEVVAAITAAITASEGSSNFVIRSVKRKNVGGRNPWAMAAVSENIKPF